MFAEAAAVLVRKAQDLGWNGDFAEAQAFAWLAARSVAGHPLSYPETTGVKRHMTGGIVRVETGGDQGRNAAAGAGGRESDTLLPPCTPAKSHPATIAEGSALPEAA